MELSQISHQTFRVREGCTVKSTTKVRQTRNQFEPNNQKGHPGEMIQPRGEGGMAVDQKNHATTITKLLWYVPAGKLFKTCRLTQEQIQATWASGRPQQKAVKFG